LISRTSFEKKIQNLSSLKKKSTLGEPDEMIKPTNKKAVSIFEQVAPDLKTNDNGEASYKVSQKNIWPPYKIIFRELHGK